MSFSHSRVLCLEGANNLLQRPHHDLHIRKHLPVLVLFVSSVASEPLCCAVLTISLLAIPLFPLVISSLGYHEPSDEEEKKPSTSQDVQSTAAGDFAPEKGCYIERSHKNTEETQFCEAESRPSQANQRALAYGLYPRGGTQFAGA